MPLIITEAEKPEILHRVRIARGRWLATKEPWPADDVTLQAICNHIEPYISPRQLRRRLDKGETIETKHGAAYYVEA